MLASDIPVKFQVPFADGAGGGYITEPVPYAPGSPGRASLTEGFPPTAFVPVASGGIPPWGADMNGILNQATAWLQWAQAGGAPAVYDATFSGQIGGYPAGAVLRASTTGNGRFWISTVDNNTSNPDASGANWLAFPDLAVQLQKPNYAADTGAVNAAVITLFPAPTSWAQIVGAPIRVKMAYTNSVTNPTLKINGLTAATMINSDGTALAVGQASAGNIVEGIPRDDGKFQVNSPIKTGASAAFVTGYIYIWPNETAPSGTLECAGQLLNIADQPNLYAVLGTRYGGDGITTFRLPDLRGEFIRGWDHGRGLDPNASTRTNAGGGITGDHVGTNQLGCAGPISITGGAITIGDPFCSGTDYVYGPSSKPFGYGRKSTPGGSTYGGSDWDTTNINDAASITGTLALSGTSGAETRPVNIYMMYVIAI